MKPKRHRRSWREFFQLREFFRPVSDDVNQNYVGPLLISFVLFMIGICTVLIIFLGGVGVYISILLGLITIPISVRIVNWEGQGKTIAETETMLEKEKTRITPKKEEDARRVGLDLSKEKLLGVVSVVEWEGGEVAERDLRFYSSGVLSPEPIPYADISRIKVYKALGFMPRIEICTNSGSKERFTLSLMGRVGGLRDRHKVLLKCCSVVNSACPDKIETKPKYLKDALALKLNKAETDLESQTGKMA